MEPLKPYDQPSDVAAEEGEVIVDGPDGVAVSLTPEAAVETSHRMLEAGMTAEGQRREARSKPSEGGSDAD
jgi:hypothetical protein